MASFKEIKEAFFNDNIPKIKKDLNKHDLEYMQSLSSALIHNRPQKLHWVLVAFTVTILFFIIWASFAQIDEIARGQGKVVPSGQNQILQNLEGGVVSEILIKEGDFVKKDQVLLKISNEKSSSSLSSNKIKILYLKAQIKRLEAELSNEMFEYETTDNDNLNVFLENEKELYLSNMKQLNSKIQILKEQLKQKQSELKDARQRIKHQKFSVEAIEKEVKMTEPMVKKGIRAEVDFLKLQREFSDSKQKLQSVIYSVNKIKSEIVEIEKKIEEASEIHKVKTQEKLNEITTSLKDLEANTVASIDQVSRAIIKSPLNGIVQALHVNTIGGAIKPAQDLIEIVPTDYNLIIEVKILPSDIAFIYQGQKAVVKFSAYDFSIYGGLDGQVINISPDTITEKDDKTYYLVRIKTEKNYIGKDAKKMKIIPGMVADVDIITGKKTILDYILKPILKTKQYTFTER
ncbi:HlyD family type I secretion periplasmic adaptor subunit [Halarcobacter sp.]|uniref:HlyD family type I secretion periplasmic adaptor subunit n=1 Tax=Halarcobacter sp. TaxID=2321133 RepID=UPI0029F49730|nr:HlyD family type I secretion periplasmic adaptor subunit [Halarcobacter sp.]